MKKLSILHHFTSHIEHLGAWQALHFSAQRRKNHYSPSRESYRLHSKNARFPLWCRPETSDIHVFNQIFVHHEYALLKDLQNVDLVLDCGANVGYSAAYFLTRFPRCKLIAVEPDEANFAMLKRNLEPYGERAQAINSGIWSHPVGLKMADETQGQGDEWSRSVREVGAGETPDFMATDIATLLKESGKPRISLLKIDIEGAEAVVFSDNFESWIAHVDALAIELHDTTAFGPASEIFYRACADHFSFQTFDEVVVGRRRL